MWNLKIDTGELLFTNKNTFTDTENKLMVTKGVNREWGRRVKLGVWD